MKTVWKYEILLAATLAATALSASSPSISFTPVHCTKVAPVSIAVVINDPDGIETTSGLAPRLYYKKISETNVLAVSNDNFSNGWKYVEASNTISPFNFEFDFSKLTGALTKNDSIQYFIVAQNLLGEVSWSNASLNNVPSSVDLTSSSFPASGTIDFFRTIKTYSGTLAIDSTGIASDTNFLSITKSAGLFDALNNAALSGNVNVVVKHSLYAENGLIALNQWEEYNGCVLKSTPSYRLKISPFSNGTQIRGSSTDAIIKLNGADRVVIDGRTSSVSGINGLTIANNLSANNTSVIQLVSENGNGCQRDTFRFCNIIGGAPQNTTTHNTFGVYSNHASISEFRKPMAKNSNWNSFERNNITRVRYGIALIGNDTFPCSSNSIVYNTIGPESDGIDAIGKAGIVVSNQHNVRIEGNIVQHVGGDISNIAGVDDRVGIYLGNLQDNLWNNSFGGDSSLTKISGAVVSGNKIHHIVNESGLSAVGIAYINRYDQSETSNLIINNMIHSVRSNGETAEGDHAAAIGIIGGHTDVIAHNSILMEDDLDPLGTNDMTNPAAGIRVNSTSSEFPIISELMMINNSIHMNVTSNNGVVCHAISLVSDDFIYTVEGLDNNNYFIEPGNDDVVVGGIGAVGTFNDYNTLGDWRNVYSPSQDANSISENPMYQSSSDLHIQAASPNINAGLVNSTVLEDIDGDDRQNKENPSIGADEFGKYFVWFGRESSETEALPNWKSFEAPPFNGSDSLKVLADTRNVSWKLTDSFNVAELLMRPNTRLNLNGYNFHVKDSVNLDVNAKIFGGIDTCVQSYGAEEIAGALYLSGTGKRNIRMIGGSICNLVITADTVQLLSDLNIGNDLISKNTSTVINISSHNVNAKGDVKLWGELLFAKSDEDDQGVLNINGDIQQVVEIRDKGAQPGILSNLHIDKAGSALNGVAHLLTNISIMNFMNLKNGILKSDGSDPETGNRYKVISMLRADSNIVKRSNGSVNNNFYQGKLRRKLDNAIKSYLFPIGIIDENGNHGTASAAYYTPVAIEVLDGSGSSNYITATFYDKDPDTANVGLTGKPYGDHSSAVEDGAGNWVDVKGNYLWHVEYDGGTLPYNIQFSAPFMSANNTDELASTPDELRVLKRSVWDSGNWGFEGVHTPATAHHTMPDFGQINMARRTGLSAFSGFSPGGNSYVGGPLPVKLIELKAQGVNNEYIQLNWATAAEINNAGFEVQRSIDGLEYAAIGFVQGSGNSAELNRYTFNDKNVATNTRYYYRLQQVDFDGSAELSNIVSAALTTKQNIKWMHLAPNPAEQASSLIVNAGNETVGELSVSGLKGEIIWSKEVRLYNGLNNLELDLKGFASGIYIVNLTTTAEGYSKRLVVK